MNGFEKAYVAIPVSSDCVPYLVGLQDSISALLIDTFGQNVFIGKPSDFHITIDYLGKKSLSKKQQFLHHMHTLMASQQEKVISFDKISHWESFVPEDGHIIALESTDPVLHEIYKSLEISEWKNDQNEEKEYKPHLTLIKFFIQNSIGVDQVAIIKKIQGLLQKPFSLSVKEYVLHDKQSFVFG